MPRAPGTPCPSPGCPAITPPGERCDDHKRSRRPDDRPSAAERGYDWTWRKARERQLAREPLCRACREKDQRTTAAVEVDHIVPLKDGGARLDPDNLQSLCRSHHARKTAREARG